MALSLLLLAVTATLASAADFSVDLRTGQYDITPDTGLSWLRPPSDPGNGEEIPGGCVWRGVLKMTFDKKVRRRAVITMKFRKSQQWSFNIGDSITNDGDSEDAGTQQRDAEVYAADSSVVIAGSDKVETNGSYGVIHVSDDFLTGRDVTVGVENQVFEADNGERFLYFNSYKLYALRGQDDREGDVNYDVYFGMNRVIADLEDRVGSGLCHVEVTFYAY